MILVVDDDPDFLSRAEQILLFPEHPVMLAGDAKHAMGLLSLLGPEEFSAALIDLNMPGENGFELIVKLHKNFPDLPLIATSGCFSEPVLESAKALGAVEALPKPITREWRKVVQAVCDNGRASRQ